MPPSIPLTGGDAAATLDNETVSPAYKNPFLWVPSSYLVMGLIYIAVGTLANIMFRQIAFRLLPAYPKLLIDFWHLLTTNPADIVDLLNFLSGIIWKGLALFGLGMFFYRILKGLHRFLSIHLENQRMRIWRTPRNPLISKERRAE